MFVCVCKAITDNDVRQAVDGGAVTMKQLKDKFAIGSQCGTCTLLTKQILNEQLDVTPCYYEVA